MRVLMLNYEYPPLGGGAGNAMKYLLTEFSKDESLLIDVVTSSATGRFEVEKLGTRVRVIKLSIHKKSVHYWKATELLEWSLKAHREVRKLMKKNRYDVVHCWFGWPSGVIGYLNRKRAPYIVSLRGSDVPGYNSRLHVLDKALFRPLSRIVWQKATRVVSNSEKLRALAYKTLRRNIEIIPNGVDTVEFRPLVTKHTTLRLISTGRLIERKGYQYLLPALKGLPVELELVGEGNLKEELERIARKQGVVVRFSGEVKHSQIALRLQQSDVFVLPSLNEGMSNSLLEAMACGLPVVVTDVGGSAELVDKNGLVVRKGSVRELRLAIEKLIKSPRLLTRMGRESRKKAQSMSWEKTAEEYKKVYG